MSILVTGATGFVGKHLLKHLRTHQTERCFGVSRNPGQDTDTVICDLANREQVYTMLQQFKPEFIYHMAGSFSNDYETDFTNNVVSTKNILDTIVDLKLPVRVLLAGSAAEYGDVTAEQNPISEKQALYPISIYGWTKAAQSQLASVYFKSHAINVLVARTFNLSGTGASEQLFIGRIQKQIAAILYGNATKISIGNVDAIRDYIDVNEACEMYRIILTRGCPGEVYNVASGKPVVMRALLKNMLKDAGLDYAIVNEMSRSKTPKETSVSYADINKYTALLKK